MSRAKIGHNNGPTMEAGFAFRKHAWTKARAALLPTLPIEILRTRVKRAQALGLPYQTYASVRASTGRDVVGFLFSNNALRMLRDTQPSPRAYALVQIEATCTALVHRPLSPEALRDSLASHGLLIATARAPHFAQGWSDIRAAVQAPLRAAQLPLDGVLVIGDTTHERDWSMAARLAGFLPSDRYFGAEHTGR
ncbi:hypothetical protein BDE40_1786 [Litoreibacter halocynthiae]|uniref:Uncharacterized protein n=1 Tax=Litoreibacter halocynthiae TaxID=1242689 RepID=A0A4R7LLQ9_9RHOB|nr:hypothetical protein [Litoreibacter halocynthiae]TDT75060.1 hypothetical protein BDE40_1786 [Litoreibacter halocynthiae]